MRIKSLHIKDYFILQDFDIDFSSNLSVIIGENGSGKSSVLECIAYIFGHLHKYFVLNDKTADFIDGYRINYEINGRDVFIESKYVSSKTNTFQPLIRINHEELTLSQINYQYGSFRFFLPEKVILAYSGITEHLKELNKHFEDKFIKKIIRQNNPYSLNPLKLPEDNPFMYMKKEFVSFVLLSLFVLNSEEAQSVLRTIGVDIDGCITTISIKKPYWAKSNKKDNKNDSLWGMKGKIASDFLKGLDYYGIRKDMDLENNPSEFKYEFYGSLIIQDLFRSFYHLYPDQVISFMDTLLCNDLLGAVNISWGNEFTVDRLSEGEKQLLLSVGLGLVMNKRNLLFLLDEPDVSLHPKWQQAFISNFTEGLNDDSMAIITTHSPILVSNLQRSFVRIIQKGKIDAKDYYSFGRDVNSILEDYFSIDERNEDGKKLIRDFYNAMDLKDYDAAEDILNRIDESFGPSDIATVKANSLFDDLAE